jgi:4-amino-4-deoxy-L-arabinose transferase-like glycosyltransferase
MSQLNRVYVPVLVIAVVVSMWFRVHALESLPGVNADEVWYGVQALKILEGSTFALRTPTGLPLNPFFTGSEIPLLLIFRPSFWILRVPAVVSGILAVVLVFTLGSRIVERRPALIASYLLATLPIAIGYSRFGWDASQTPLFSMMALYFAFRGKTLVMLVSLGVCLVVHFSNVFLFPVLMGPFVVSVWRTERDEGKRLAIVAMTILLMLIPLVALVMMTPPSQWLDLLSRFRPSNWLRFLTHYGRLMSGISLYEFVAGPPPAPTVAVHDAAFWSLLVGLLVAGVPCLVRDKKWDQLSLLGSLFIGALSLYLFFGPDVIRPHRERYGLFLVVPTILVAGCLISALLFRFDSSWEMRLSNVPMALTVCLGWASLYSFYVNDFARIRRTGGESHLAFRAAEVEPKRQALQLILDDLSSPEGTTPSDGTSTWSAGARKPGPPPDHGARLPVLAENWWLFWPLRFLAWDQEGLTILSLEDERFAASPGEAQPRDSLVNTLRSGGYVVTLTGGKLDRLVSSSVPPVRLRRWDVRDYSGRELIAVYRVKSL